MMKMDNLSSEKGRTIQRTSLLRLFFSCFMVFFSVVSALSQQIPQENPQVKVDIDHATIPLDGVALLSVTVEGSQNVEITPPKMKGISFRKGASSQQFSMVNGQTSFSLTHNYLLQGEHEGEYTIPPFTIFIDGEDIQTKSFTLTITAAGSRSGRATRNSSGIGAKQPQSLNKVLQSPNGVETLLQDEDIAFLEIETPQKAYIGESVPITIKAYFNAQVRIEAGTITPPNLSGEGFSMSPVGESPIQQREERNGRVWDVLTWETTASGVKIGEYRGEIVMNAIAILRHKRKRNAINDPLGSLFGNSGNDPFNDPFFDSVFSNFVRRPIQLKGEVHLETFPLPEKNCPANFSGAIGDFDIKVSARTENIAVNEPFVVTTTITGVGNFEKITAPPLKEKDDEKDAIRTYPPKTSFEAMGRRGAGEKRFEQAVVVRDEKMSEIPPLLFSYFNPKTREYVTKKSESIPLFFSSKSKSQNNRTIENFKKNEKPKEMELKEKSKSNEEKPKKIDRGAIKDFPQKVKIGKLHPNAKPLPHRIWFITLAIILLTINLFLGGMRLYQRWGGAEKRAQNKAAKKRLIADLKTVENAKNKGDGHLFLSASRVAIQNCLARHCKMHPSAISLGDLQRILPENSSLSVVFEISDKARYSGTVPDSVEMDALYTQLKEELEVM